MTDHKHTWTRSPRVHGDAVRGRLFVVCADCGEERQASTATGVLRVFTSRVDKGGRTVAVSFRLDKARYKKLRARKVNVRKVIEDHIDKL